MNQCCIFGVKQINIIQNYNLHGRLKQLPVVKDTFFGIFKHGWEDGWVGGWMEGRMGGRMDGWMDGLVGGWVEGWVGGLVGGWMDIGLLFYQNYCCIITK